MRSTISHGAFYWSATHPKLGFHNLILIVSFSGDPAPQNCGIFPLMDPQTGEVPFSVLYNHQEGFKLHKRATQSWGWVDGRWKQRRGKREPKCLPPKQCLSNALSPFWSSTSRQSTLGSKFTRPDKCCFKEKWPRVAHIASRTMSHHQIQGQVR